MGCKHPLKGFKIGINPETGKNILKITGYLADHVEKTPDGKLIVVNDNTHAPANISYNDFVDIPCGKCDGCRLSRAKQKTDRAVLELPYCDSAYFLTITYDEDHVPKSEYINPVTGEYAESLTLKKEDLQGFFKRLRSQISYYDPDRKIRMCSAGEYGETTRRPHYHSIVFNLKIPDLKFYTITNNDDVLYTSEWLNSIWKKGNIWIGEVTYKSIAYVNRYITKKCGDSEKEYYSTFNIVPEFYVASNRPGIGRQYYEDHKDDLFKEVRYYFPMGDGVGSASPSRYFFNLFEGDFDAVLVKAKKDDLKANFESRKAIKLEHTSQNYLDLLKTEEYNLKCRTKKLSRDKI